MPERALLALQGPKAIDVLSRMVPGVEKLVFMTGASFDWQSADLFITRSGYTGEDGFEISVHNDQADLFARALLAQAEVKPIGLGARNSLRLEAGLCLYGNDIDTSTTPIEAGLNWAIQKVRRTGGARVGGFPAQTLCWGNWMAAVPSPASVSDSLHKSECQCVSMWNYKIHKASKLARCLAVY